MGVACRALKELPPLSYGGCLPRPKRVALRPKRVTYRALEESPPAP